MLPWLDKIRQNARAVGAEAATSSSTRMLSWPSSQR